MTDDTIPVPDPDFCGTAHQAHEDHVCTCQFVDGHDGSDHECATCGDHWDTADSDDTIPVTMHEHVSPEEQEPSGRLILAPCLTCDLSALDAIKEVRDIMANLRSVIDDVRDAYAHRSPDYYGSMTVSADAIRAALAQETR